jgi:hypothetical protein
MSLDADCGRMMGSGSNANVADGGIRKDIRSDEIRPIIRPCSNVGNVGAQTLARSYST